MQGKVVWFNAQKGFGFLSDEATNKEYFCHFSAIQSEGYKKLDEGQRVRFNVVTGPKGKDQADNVVVIG